MRPEALLPRAAGLLVCLPLLAAPMTAQVQGLDAVHRDGQTFLTWQELPGSGLRYRVWRGPQPFTDPAQLAGADLLGEVGQDSAWNERRSQVDGLRRTWVVDPLQGELPDGTGLFVATTEAAGTWWYAVTFVDPVLGEDTTLVPGANATVQGIAETPAPPRAILQGPGPEGEVWAHWTTNRDTPFLEAMSLRPSRAFNFQIARGPDSGPQGLLLRLHGRNADYSSAWPVRADLPGDLTTLDLDDPMEDPTDESQNSHWFGYTVEWPELASPGDLIRLFTLRRVEWTLDYVQAEFAAELDPARVHVAGTSMGGTGTWKVATHLPDRFASAFSKNGNSNARMLPPLHAFPNIEMWGEAAWNNPTPTGEGVWDLADANWMSERDRARDWPLIQFLQGRQDVVIGWEPVPLITSTLTEHRRPFRLYFDERTHGTHIFGNWMPWEPLLIERFLEERLGVPQLAVSEATVDGDPGGGDPAEGDPWGAVGAAVDWDRSAVVEGPDFVEFRVWLRSEGAPDDSPEDSGRAILTPRRLNLWDPAAGDWVLFQMRENGVLLDEHLIQTDAWGWTPSPSTPLSRTPREARWEAWTPPPAPGLFVGGAPAPGDTVQAVLFGSPGEAWSLYGSLRLGTTITPFGALGLDQARILASGGIGGDGWAEVLGLLPGLPGLSGRLLHFQAGIGSGVSNLVSVRVQ